MNMNSIQKTSEYIIIIIIVQLFLYFFSSQYILYEDIHCSDL